MPKISNVTRSSSFYVQTFSAPWLRSEGVNDGSQNATKCGENDLLMAPKHVDIVAVTYQEKFIKSIQKGK